MVAVNYFIKFIILGCVFLVTGLAMLFGLPPLISFYVDTQMVLTPGSQSYPLWKEVPVPIYQKFFFFNVTNAQEVEQYGHRPYLDEIGPFTYRADWQKRDIEVAEDRSTIKFRHHKQWHFEPDLSIADHRMQLVTINAPLAITLTLIQSSSSAVRILVTFSLDGLSEGFFTKRSVKQLLFDGYPDLLTTFGPLLNAEMLSQGGHFGYMNARNNSYDGRYEIHTGAADKQKLNTIKTFNGRSKLPYWNQHQGECTSLAGATTGEMFPSTLEPYQDSLRLFQPDFCRSWRLDFDSHLDHSSGLRLKRFKATRDIFRNSTDLGDNSCYFANPRRAALGAHSPNAGSHANSQQAVTNRIGAKPQAAAQTAPSGRPGAQTRARQPASAGPTGSPSGRQQAAGGHAQPAGHGAGRHASNSQAPSQAQANRNANRVRHEWPAGVFTLAPCKFNAPIFLSMPHFLDADPFFRAHLDGLQPDASKHEFYIDVEPRTGSPVTLSARVQINVAVSKPSGLVRFRNVPEIMFPVFWQELSVNVTGPVIDQLLLASRRSFEAAESISYSFLALGLAILVTTGVFYVHMRRTLHKASSAR